MGLRENISGKLTFLWRLGTRKTPRVTDSRCDGSSMITTRGSSAWWWSATGGSLKGDGGLERDGLSWTSREETADGLVSWRGSPCTVTERYEKGDDSWCPWTKNLLLWELTNVDYWLSVYLIGREPRTMPLKFRAIIALSACIEHAKK